MPDDVGGGRRPFYDPGVESDRQREALDAAQQQTQAEVAELREAVTKASQAFTGTDEVSQVLWMRRFA